MLAALQQLIENNYFNILLVDKGRIFNLTLRTNVSTCEVIEILRFKLFHCKIHRTSYRFIRNLHYKIAQPLLMIIKTM